MIGVRLARPWLIADLGAPHRALGWAAHRPGLIRTRHVLWREVRDADLTESLDAGAWLAAEAAAFGMEEAAAMITSRDIARHHHAEAQVEGAAAVCFATVGLSNRERIGARRAPPAPAGTINALVKVSAPLTIGALAEALSLAASARTLAVLEAGLDDGAGPATGTGTDCLIVAAPEGEGAGYAGTHTPLGEAVGAAVLAALRAGVGEWVCEPKLRG